MDQKYSEFREFDKSLKPELGSILRSFLLPVYSWQYGNILVSTQEVVG